MKEQHWIFTVRYASEVAFDVRDRCRRRTVVGPARASTVEAALHLAGVPEAVRAEIRADETVRGFIEGTLDPEANGYYVLQPFPMSRPWAQSWVVCIGPVHEVLR
jgi:hypothetical protein